MGWTFPYHTTERKTLISDRIQGWEGEMGKAVVLKYCIRGNNLWKLIEYTYKETNKKIRFIALDLMQKSDGLWGYKDLDDSGGLSYYNCPLSYIEACTDTDSESATKWRDNVREYWEDKRQQK